MQRASYRRNFTPAQPDNPATSLRDFVSGAYIINLCLHAHYGGRPLMASMFDRILDYFQSSGQIWFAR